MVWRVGASSSQSRESASVEVRRSSEIFHTHKRGHKPTHRRRGPHSFIHASARGELKWHSLEQLTQCNNQAQNGGQHAHEAHQGCARHEGRRRANMPTCWAGGGSLEWRMNGLVCGICGSSKIKWHFCPPARREILSGASFGLRARRGSRATCQLAHARPAGPRKREQIFALKPRVCASLRPTGQVNAVKRAPF